MSHWIPGPPITDFMHPGLAAERPPLAALGGGNMAKFDQIWPNLAIFGQNLSNPGSSTGGLRGKHCFSTKNSVFRQKWPFCHFHCWFYTVFDRFGRFAGFGTRNTPF